MARLFTDVLLSLSRSTKMEIKPSFAMSLFMLVAKRKLRPIIVQRTICTQEPSTLKDLVLTVFNHFTKRSMNRDSTIRFALFEPCTKYTR
jgi:hypothetical protein